MHSLENLQRLHSIGGGLHRKAALFQRTANGVADQHGVVDDQRYRRHEFATCGMHAPGRQINSMLRAETRKKRAYAVTMVSRVSSLRFRGVPVDAFFDA